MSKNITKSTRYAIQWETHPKNLLKNFCSLMEHQSLVDVVMCCGNNTIQAHKFVLAANSPLFREEFEKNPCIEQIMIGGCDFTVLKNVVEMMYCGQTVINEDNVKFLVAVLKLFQMKHLENLFSDHTGPTEDIYLPKPQFLTKKPKYPAFTYQLPPGKPQNACIITKVPVTAAMQPGSAANTAQFAVTLPNNANVTKPLDFNINVPDYMASNKSYVRNKKTLKQQAEQACVKEAQASRLALASLQKEIASTPQISSFIIEDTCTETTVENFIPHTEPTPFAQVLNYNNLINESLENAMFLPVSIPQKDNQGLYNGATTQEKNPLTPDKLKCILGTQIPNVEIMYKDAEGNYVPVNEEVLQKLFTKDGLQYQVVDEEGRVSELQELQVINKIDSIHNPISKAEIIDVIKPALEVGDFLKDTESSLSVRDGLCSIISKTGEETLIPRPVIPIQSTMELPSLESTKPSSEVDLKFSPLFFSDIISDDVQNDITVVEDDVFVKTCHKIETID